MSVGRAPPDRDRAIAGETPRGELRGDMLRTLLVVVGVLLAIATSGGLSGCGGPRTRMIEGHTVVLEETQDRARIAVDGVQLRVVYSPSEDRYRSPGCDFGSAASVDSLAEQMATSPTTCERLETE